MLNIVLSNRFKKDLKLMAKRGCDLKKLNSIVNRIAAGETLEPKYKVHNLIGNYAGFSECHIEPDWLLVYRIDGDDLILFLFRTGTHSDLFD